MLEIQDLAVHFGARTLFENVNVQLYSRHRYGLIGANGTGKSTLLSILSGENTEYTGRIQMPAGTQIGVLQQDQFRYEDTSLVDTVLQGRQELWQALQEQQRLSQKDHFSEADTEAFARCQSLIEKENGYAAESEAAQLLSGLGLPTEKHTQPMRSLSGGFKLRVLMAQLLFSKPDLLLLDEPTNHLDIYAIHWLGQYLQRYEGLLIVVSHDREFLNEVCSEILDIDYGSLQLYTGNYNQFESAKALAQEQKLKDKAKQDKQREHAEQFINRFRYKASKAASAQSRIKMLEKMDSIEIGVSSRRAPHFAFEIQRPSGKVPLQLEHIDKAFASLQVLKDVGFELERGDRAALIGPNGVGKSTLLKILMRELPADGGQFEWGHAVECGYFPQDYHQILPPHSTLLQWLSQTAGDEPESHIRALLGRVLFTGDEAQHKISTLSGGEATRLVFARLMQQSPNVLILDEPTNHLDIEAIDALADALKDYEGTLLFVSHNRHFVHRLANRIFEIQPEGIQDFKGTYAEYLARENTDHLARQHRPKDNATSEEKVQNQLDYEAQKAHKRQLKQLEKRLPELEDRVQELEDQLQSTETALAAAYAQGGETQALLQAQQQLQQELEETMNEWEETENSYQSLSS